MGMDVGIISETDEKYYQITQENYQNGTLIHGSMHRILTAKLNKNVQILSAFSQDGIEYPTAYKYENAKGQKFLVFTFFIEELNDVSTLKANYYRQEQLIDGIEWIASSDLPAKIYKNFDAYLLCKRTENSLKVGVFNCYGDEIINPKIILNKQYRSLKMLNSSGKLEGDAVLLEDIAPFKFTCFEVFDE